MTSVQAIDMIVGYPGFITIAVLILVFFFRVTIAEFIGNLGEKCKKQDKERKDKVYKADDSISGSGSQGEEPGKYALADDPAAAGAGAVALAMKKKGSNKHKKHVDDDDHWTEETDVASGATPVSESYAPSKTPIQKNVNKNKIAPADDNDSWSEESTLRHIPSRQPSKQPSKSSEGP